MVVSRKVPNPFAGPACREHFRQFRPATCTVTSHTERYQYIGVRQFGKGAQATCGPIPSSGTAQIAHTYRLSQCDYRRLRSARMPAVAGGLDAYTWRNPKHSVKLGRDQSRMQRSWRCRQTPGRGFSVRNTGKLPFIPYPNALNISLAQAASSICENTSSVSIRATRLEKPRASIWPKTAAGV